MKNKFNTLQKYIFDNSVKEYHKETIDGIFRAILEPVASNQKFEACVLFRLFDLTEKESLLKRISFANNKMISFSDVVEENQEKENIWGSTQFVVVLGSRYSVAYIWDYETGTQKDYSNVCLIYNSRIITEIAKVILDNSKNDFQEFLQKYTPDRRENSILNRSIKNISDLLNDRNEEILFEKAQQMQAINSDDTLKTANIVADKAKFIAHEIKNNLSIINLYAKITEKRLEKVEFEGEAKQSLETALNNINSASQTISALINDLRSLSAPYITNLSLQNLVLNTALLCQEKAKKAGVELVVAKFDDCNIDSDKTKLESALTNLIFNAIEACSEGGSVCIDCFVEPREVRIFVKNNGEKIPSDLYSRIFDANFTTKQKGNGLGLAICKSQMKLVNGDINLVHSNNVETLFEIVLKR